MAVSIHALTRRATSPGCCGQPSASVSIHALTRRATTSLGHCKGIQDGFNPRPHAEGDNPQTPAQGKSFVSIHALTRRATPVDCSTIEVSLFQSTPSRGGRRWSANLETLLCCFNPRPHAEGDPATFGLSYIEVWVSIHALTRRATTCA